MGQTIQMLGAVIVLAGFIGNQRFGLSSSSPWFLAANAVGTTILAIVAAVNHDLGFTLLEGVWAVVSFASLIRLFSAPQSALTP